MLITVVVRFNSKVYWMKRKYQLCKFFIYMRNSSDFGILSRSMVERLLTVSIINRIILKCLDLHKCLIYIMFQLYAVLYLYVSVYITLVLLVYHVYLIYVLNKSYFYLIIYNYLQGLQQLMVVRFHHHQLLKRGKKQIY